MKKHHTLSSIFLSCATVVCFAGKKEKTPEEIAQKEQETLLKNLRKMCATCLELHHHVDEGRQGRCKRYFEELFDRTEASLGFQKPTELKPREHPPLDDMLDSEEA